jgi:hypothetical protein
LSNSIFNCTILIAMNSMQPWWEMAETLAIRRRRQRRGAAVPRRVQTRRCCARMDATLQHKGHTCRRTVGRANAVPLLRARARRRSRGH